MKYDQHGDPVLHLLGPWDDAWLEEPRFKDWLRVSGGYVHCLFCRATLQHNEFNTGRPVSEEWNVGRLKQHCGKTCKKHADATRDYKSTTKMSTEMKKSRRKKLESMKDTLLVVIAAVYWLALEDVAMRKLKSLYSMIRKLPGFKLEQTGDTPYVNSARCRELVTSLSNVLKGKLWQDIKSSLAVSVLIDESTDISTSENMIIYFIFLKDGVQTVSYVALLHAPKVDAASITELLMSYLEDNGLPMHKVSCFCSDGASVMTGCENGVAARLKRHNPFMLSIHCIAHRLALCCADAAADVDYPTEAEVTINEISAFFNRSGKQTMALAELAKQFEISRTKIVKSGKTRWLSREGAVLVLFQLYIVLCHHLSADQGNDVAIAIYNMLTMYSFLATVAGMLDMLQYLGSLSRSFQSDGMNYSIFCQRLNETRCCIVDDFLPRVSSAAALDPNSDQKFWDNEWNQVLKFGLEAAGYKPAAGSTVTAVKEETTESAVYRGVELKKTDEDEGEMELWHCKLGLAMLSRLAERFPHNDMGLMEALDVFNLSNVPFDKAKLLAYGDVHMQTLIKHYGNSKAPNGKVFQPQVDAKQCVTQWKLMRQTMWKDRTKGTDNSTFWRDQLVGGSLDDRACIKHFVCIWLVLPYSTACCERGFSKMGIFKTALRNRKYVETLDALMMLSLVGAAYFPDDGCPVSEEVCNAFFEEAIRDWENSKMRMPHQCRFGNQCANKKKSSVARTAATAVDCGSGAAAEAPTFDAEGGLDADAGGGLDADADEQEAEDLATVNLTTVEIDEAFDVGPFSVPNKFKFRPTAPKMEKAVLKKIPKFAYKFPEGWETCTFKGFYNGKKTEYEGMCVMHFQAFRTAMYLDLSTEPYGLDQSWLALDRS